MQESGWMDLECLTQAWRLGMVAKMGEKATVLQGLADGIGRGSIVGQEGGV